MMRELLEKEAFGMVEIYYGEANGKTRLCTGTAIRAALKKKNVLMVSFGEDYDDYSGLFEIAPHITRLMLPANAGVREYFDHAARIAMTFRYSVLILDGVFDSVEKQQLSISEVDEFLSNAPDSLEIICTGEKVQERFLKIADEIVELRKG
ncbi:cob(I)yrinic acid a,c-diamide adenosyltransferase [Ruminococcus difficilis]|uniref:Cob(I)yrinic acid a,c-diamide adenosyltransferase n=1 Tax=Ruminococcus difficilis TaxID=2763069 RepID=A0A934U0C8_9FIRM|nr:cob(I)yrinic acid a,c-diamide adenosyltransferase [Ruminococcus difficilis]MBK6088273.1 cob(I)yrinic acid a,c-diamide adenosyltransferase [Ruminococcus difficilis]